jgi:hypothetical protein
MSGQPAYGSINLLKEFESILKGIGRPFVIRRLLTTWKCSCRKERPDGSANPSCPTCEGLGHPFIENEVVGYAQLQAPTDLFRTEIGMINEESWLFFFPVEAQIEPTDVIYSVALDNATARTLRPYHRLATFQITQHVEMAGDRGGRTDYMLYLAREIEHKRGLS